MVANNANSEDPKIQSVPGHSTTFEMKPPYTIDMNLCSWYNPRKSYLVCVLLAGHHSQTNNTAPFSDNIHGGWQSNDLYHVH